MYKCICCRRVEPSPDILQVLRQVPVIERHQRLDPPHMALIQHIYIMFYARFIDFSLEIFDDSRPGNRKPVGILSALFHHADIFFVSVIMIAGHIPVFIIVFVKIHIPHRLSLAVLVPCALTLIGSGGAAKQKLFLIINIFHPIYTPFVFAKTQVISLCFPDFPADAVSNRVPPSLRPSQEPVPHTSDVPLHGIAGCCFPLSSHPHSWISG